MYLKKKLDDTQGAVSGKYWMLTSVGAPGKYRDKQGQTVHNTATEVQTDKDSNTHTVTRMHTHRDKETHKETKGQKDKPTQRALDNS